MTTDDTSYPFDLASIRLGESPGSIPSITKAKPPRHQKKDKFLAGPIPMDWLIQAGRLKGKALHIGLLLWFEAGINKTAEVTLRQSLAREFRCHEDTVLRAVRELEKAGLVSISNLPGHSLHVTLLDAPAEVKYPAKVTNGTGPANPKIRSLSDVTSRQW